MTRPLSARQIWGVPAALGVLSLVGLVAALVADGWGDALSWLALAVPAAVSLWGFRRRPPPGGLEAPGVEATSAEAPDPRAAGRPAGRGGV